MVVSTRVQDDHALTEVSGEHISISNVSSVMVGFLGLRSRSCAVSLDQCLDLEAGRSFMPAIGTMISTVQCSR